MGHLIRLDFTDRSTPQNELWEYSDGRYTDWEEATELLRKLEAERDTLKAECEAWRKAEHLRKNEPHNEFLTLAKARAATDEAGALKGVE